MNRCITSFGFGRLKSWFDVSRPLMESYSSRIGCEFFVPDENYFSDWASKQSLFNWGIHHQMCWLKIPLLSSLLDKYDEVVWIDADVLVTGDDNVFDDMPAAPMGIAVHRFAAGEIPNTGVWAVRKPAKAILDSIEIDPDIVENAVWKGPVGYNGESVWGWISINRTYTSRQLISGMNCHTSIMQCSTTTARSRRMRCLFTPVGWTQT